MEIIKPGYIRVSDILSIFQAYAHVDRKRLKKAQDTGTIVHKAIECFYEDEFSPIPKAVLGYFESFLKWNDKVRPTPLILEKRYYDDELLVTGRVDMIADINGEKVLVDFKTGSWEHRDIWNLQADFYKWLSSEDYIVKKDDLNMEEYGPQENYRHH